MTDKKIAVIKVGGDVLLDEAESSGLANNVKALIDAGWQLVIIHGGGPQTNQLQKKIGLTPHKVNGRRITGKNDLTVVKQAIAGEVNVDLTALLLAHGVLALGCHGASGNFIQGKKRPPQETYGFKDPIDFGEVGDVSNINTALLHGLFKLNVIPVIATLCIGDDGRVFNINADTSSAAIAMALQADLMLMVTQVGAVFEDLKLPDTRIETINAETVHDLIEKNIIQGGMIPKVQEAVELVEKGVRCVAIVSAKESGSFLSVAEGNSQYGTKILPLGF